MTKLAHKIHPNDQAFVDLVHQVWSRKQNEAAQLFKSDLGNDVDLDVLEYIDDKEKKAYNQVREAAKRRIQERAAMLRGQIVEAGAEHEPKKRKLATKSDQNQKGSKRKPVPLSKKDRKTSTSVAQRFAKLPNDLQLIVTCKLSLQWKHLLLSRRVLAQCLLICHHQPLLEGTVPAAEPLLEGTAPADEEPLLESTVPSESEGTVPAADEQKGAVPAAGSRAASQKAEVV